MDKQDESQTMADHLGVGTGRQYTILDRIESRQVEFTMKMSELKGSIGEILNSLRWNLRVQTVALIILAGVNVTDKIWP